MDIVDVIIFLLGVTMGVALGFGLALACSCRSSSSCPGHATQKPARPFDHQMEELTLPEVVYVSREGRKYHLLNQCKKVDLTPLTLCLHCQKHRALLLGRRCDASKDE